MVGAAPNARILRLTPAAVPPGAIADHLLGIGVGIEDKPGMENLRHVTALRPDGTLDPATLDASTRAIVVVFQTWLGVGDTQILVDLRTGRLLSIDHGEWCPDPANRDDPAVIETPGVPPDFARDAALIDAAVDKIEGIADHSLVEAVARMPSDPEWNSATDRRFAVAEWLAWRRGRLREVMSQWSRKT
jgi:hypothetical protein